MTNIFIALPITIPTKNFAGVIAIAAAIIFVVTGVFIGAAIITSGTVTAAVGIRFVARVSAIAIRVFAAFTLRAAVSRRTL